MEFGMHIAEDFKKMTDQFRSDYQNRIARCRGLFRDTRQLLTGFRTDHKKMATELHQFLRASVQRMRNECTRMMGEFHGESEHRKTQCRQMHGAAQTFFRAMAQARHMHPLRGEQHAESFKRTPAGRKMQRRRKHHTPAN